MLKGEMTAYDDCAAWFHIEGGIFVGLNYVSRMKRRDEITRGSLGYIGLLWDGGAFLGVPARYNFGKGRTLPVKSVVAACPTVRA